jgi:hypothetical protein
MAGRIGEAHAQLLELEAAAKLGYSPAGVLLLRWDLMFLVQQGVQ